LGTDDYCYYDADENCSPAHLASLYSDEKSGREVARTGAGGYFAIQFGINRRKTLPMPPSPTLAVMR
jgi:hypothetical protein